MSESQTRLVGEDEALLLLKLAAKAEAAQAALNLALNAIAAKYGIQGPAVFTYGTRLVMPAPEIPPQEEGND